MEFYEVLYNDCYGGFHFPLEFLEKVFQTYPPHSEVGKSLWKKENITKFISPDKESEEKLKYNTYVIQDYIPFCEGYWKLKYEEKFSSRNIYITDKTDVYYLSVYGSDMHTWRSNPEVIQLAKDSGILDVKIRHTVLRVGKVAVGFSFYIDDYDGMESVVPEFPTEDVIGDLLSIVFGKHKYKVNPLTQKLLNGYDLKGVLYPKLDMQ